MSKRIYPVTVENGELVESSEKLTVNGLPISKDGTIDSSYVSGSSSEWTVDANGNLVPKDGEPVQVGSLSSDEQSINNSGGLTYAGHTVNAILEADASGLREEHGQVTHNDPGNASDDTWGTATTDGQSVSFSTAFASTPRVLNGSDLREGIVRATNQSTTGFDSYQYYYASANSIGFIVDWLAIGPE